MKNKFRHSKLISGLTMGLVAVSVATVGFSAWVIKGTASETQTGNVSVTVGDVQDQRVTLAVGAKSGVKEGAINFDAPATDNGQGTITGTGTEDLEFSIQFTATLEDIGNFKGISVTMSEVETSHIADFVTNEYIIAPFATAKTPLISQGWLAGIEDNNSASKTVYYDKDAVNTATSSTLPNGAKAGITISRKATVYTFDVVYTFAWGNLFGFKNPINSTSEKAIAGIKDMAGKAPQFTLTLYHDPGSAVTIN